VLEFVLESGKLLLVGSARVTRLGALEG
jgi:hypothetical protein